MRNRILAIGDIHGNLEMLKKMLQKLKTRNTDFSGILLVGDIGDNYLGRKNNRDNLLNYQRSFLSVFGVIRDFYNQNMPVFFVRGNHDLPTIPFLKMFSFKNHPNIFDLELGQKNFGGKIISGVGGAPMNVAFPYGWEDDAIQEVVFYKQLKESDILVSHCPPWGYGDLTNSSARVGSQSLLQAINLLENKDKTKIIVSGHIHEDYGIRKKDNILIVNCGAIAKSTDKMISTFIDLDNLSVQQYEMS